MEIELAEKPGRASDQFPLRFPDGMRDRIKGEAEQNSRSMNAEIIARLQDTLDLDDNLALRTQIEKKIRGTDLDAIYGELKLIRAALGPVIESRVLPDGSEEVTFLRKRAERVTDDRNEPSAGKGK